MPLPPLYDPEAVRPMWEELADCRVKPLHTAEEVDGELGQPGTALVVVNSVCGCAAGAARPGVTRALQNARIPDRLLTVFAGVDREATERARAHMTEVAPSSPCIALFRDGRPIHILERQHIERMTPEMVAGNLTEVFDSECTAEGPSVPREIWEKSAQDRMCGSSVPRFGAPVTPSFR